jgi:hypothetical protein
MQITLASRARLWRDFPATMAALWREACSQAFGAKGFEHPSRQFVPPSSPLSGQGLVSVQKCRWEKEFVGGASCSD